MSMAYLSDHQIIDMHKTVFINPEVPYIYLPHSDYNMLMTILKGLYGDTIDCTSDHCKFHQTCDNVDLKNGIFNFTLKDSVNEFTFDLGKEYLLIDGHIFNEDNTCYYAIFKHMNDELISDWYIGNIFMDKYYIVYDMTPVEEFDKDYNQIGFGLKSTVIEVGKEHYDPMYTYYWPENKTLDMSHVMPPYPNPYDSSNYEKREKMRERGEWPNPDYNPPDPIGWMQQHIQFVLILGGSLSLLFLICIVCF